MRAAWRYLVARTAIQLTHRLGALLITLVLAGAAVSGVAIAQSPGGGAPPASCSGARGAVDHRYFDGPAGFPLWLCNRAPAQAQLASS